MIIAPPIPVPGMVRNITSVNPRAAPNFHTSGHSHQIGIVVDPNRHSPAFVPLLWPRAIPFQFGECLRRASGHPSFIHYPGNADANADRELAL